MHGVNLKLLHTALWCIFNTRSLELEHCIDAMNGLFSNLLKKLSADKIEFECIKLSTALMLSMMAKMDSLSSSQEYSVLLAKLRKSIVESIQNFLKDWLATEGGVIGSKKFGGDFVSTGWFSRHTYQPKLSQEVEVSTIILYAVCNISTY